MTAMNSIADCTHAARADGEFDAEISALIQRIMSQTIDDGGCAIWQLGCASAHHPCLRHEGKNQLVRRLLWAALHGPIPPGKVVRMACDAPLCIRPKHMTLVTRKALAKALGALGLMSGPVRSAAIARAKRASVGKLSDEQVREIKTSNEAGMHIAKRMGVSQSHVSKIRQNKIRREFSSPWSQLL